MNLLVTGGAGFVGARVAAQLVAAGHSVTVFDDLSQGHAEAVPEAADFVEGDLRDAAAIRSAVEGQDAVVHLAALALVPESMRHPQLTFDINLLGGQNLLEAMRAEGVERLVYSSTAAVYGAPVRVPIAEDDPTRPISPYGATKLAFEHLLHAYHAAYGLHVTAFRYFNPYGPGERHDPETHAVPVFIRSLLEGRAVPLFAGGTQERDFFHVDDIARAHAMALDQDGFHIYNLGSGRPVPVRQVLAILAQLAGRPVEVEDRGQRSAGDPPQLVADITRAGAELGWEPEIGLEEGLAATWEDMKNSLA